MTKLLLRLFVPNHEHAESAEVRTACGSLCGWVGIVCNAILCAAKLFIGIVSGSISITADAVNNLSDAAASVVTLLGFKLASKPADDEHPYGHDRIEYLAGLAVAVLIFIIGFELIKSSVDKILHPAAVEFSPALVIVLLLSIGVKLWLAHFNRTLGKKISSSALAASAADSRNDVLATSAVLLACVIGKLTGFMLDGYIGFLVAVFILYSGIGIIKDTIDPLLGAAP
ncbi:MAG: cation transporter, partial [Oscillospiraceae bacterium]|nr:cation transporter [Oscillospiraceae bacterium]